MKSFRSFLIFAIAASAAFGRAADAGPAGPGKGVSSPAPSIEVSGLERSGDWEKGFETVYRTLLKNLHGPNRFFEVRFAYPSPIFRGVYLWDTAFISQVWRTWDREAAQDVTWAVLSKARDGRLQHYSSQWGKSDYTQPPVMAWSIWENYQKGGAGRDFIEKAYPVLKDYNRWLYDNRRLDNGLFHWLHSYESGLDNSPRFGSADESYMVDMEKLAAVDLCSYVILQNESLAAMAGLLGRTKEAGDFRAKAEELKELVEASLWDEETGFYYDLDLASGEPVKIRTVAGIFPLMAGVPSPERARRVVERVMDPDEFNTPMPLPSVARNDPHFEKDCWRGPIWLNTAYMATRGLIRYGYEDEASLMCFKLVDGVYRTYGNTGKLVEFYDPDRFDFRELHRKKGNLYKQLTLGGKPRPNFVGWTGLANTMLIEDLIGYGRDPGGVAASPAFPDEAQGVSVRLEIPADGVTVEVKTREEGASETAIAWKDLECRRRLKKGEALSLDFATGECR